MLKTPFRESLRIQIRVVLALIQRDFISLFGRKGFGFLMLFIEPLVIIGCLVVFISARRLNSSVSFPVLAFALSGWGLMWLCRYPINKIAGAIYGNASFLYHRNIKIRDILISRAIMLVVGSFSSFVILFLIYTLVVDEPLYDLGYFLLSLALTVWYSFFVTLLAGLIAGYAPMGDKLLIILSFVHAFCTGAFFMLDWLPQQYQDLLLYIPMINITEMIRYGMFGDRITCHFSVLFPVSFNIVMSFIVLFLIDFLSKTKNLHAVSQ
jgi:capsular polysaccharide transport system permease protein